MEEKTEKKPFMKRIKPVLYIIGILLIIYYIAPIFTGGDKFKENTEVLKAIDSLKQETIKLEQHQAYLDSLSQEYELKIVDVDDRISNIKSGTTIIKEYHHDRIKNSTNYNSTQVDSFFKDRYNY
jgi:hypothetical protein